MKKMPAKGRPVKPSGMLTKLLGQGPAVASSGISLQQSQKLYEEAVQEYQRAEWQRAEARIDELLSMPGLHPTHQVSALNLKATLAARTHRLPLAVQLYQDILARQPGHVEALSNQGLALQKMQRHEEALACLLQAVRLRPGHANSHLNLGLTYQSLGRREEARAAYLQVLALEPGRIGQVRRCAGDLLHQERARGTGADGDLRQVRARKPADQTTVGDQECPFLLSP